MNEPTDCIRIPLHRADRTIRGYALLDWEDESIAALAWYWHHGYAARTVYGNGTHWKEYMHRMVLGFARGDGRRCDHINRDKLDCRRVNLREVTHAQNMQNVPAQHNASSAYRGVHWAKNEHKWVAQGSIGGRSRHLGYFTDELDAAAASARFRAEHMPFATD